MGFLSFFTGKSAEQIETRADSLFHDHEYGLAKIEYEKALAKIEKEPNTLPEVKNRIEKKWAQSKEQLASQHLQHARELIEADCRDEALDLLQLARELTSDETLAAEIQENLHHLSDAKTDSKDLPEHLSDEDEPWEADEYFSALINALPQPVQEAYLGYGPSFKTGLIALNQGDFPAAVHNLTAALETGTAEKNLIPLELATAYLNQGEYNQAESLLLEFLQDFPNSVRAYQLLCEIHWENRKFNDAETLIQNSADEIRESLPMQMLLGETHFLAGEMETANRFYQELLDKKGWDDQVAQAMARTCEELGKNEEARELYGKIIGNCQGCGRRIDLVIKQRYAETGFQTGDASPALLELFFSLTQENPENQSFYHERIGQIYSRQGNEKEARRFLSLKP